MMAETKERKASIELLHYQKARMSMSEQERIHFVLKENGNCEGFLDMMENNFNKKFFILDVAQRKFSYYTDNPKKKNDARKIGSVDVSDITKVSEAPPKIKRSNAFEVHTPNEKHILAAKDERDRKIWIQALKKAATSPAQVSQKIGSKPEYSSLENLNVLNEAQRTAIIGGCVIKTPVSTMENRRNNSNTATRSGLRILREGYCYKQGAVMKNWKRRYFRLNAIKLSYYETQEEQNPIRSITTNDIRNVRILERYSNRSNVIEVDTPARKFYMDPEAIEDVQLWKNALEDIIQSQCSYIPRTKSV